MRILVINWQDIRNPLAGGAEVHLHEIFSRIAKMGHEVTLFCSSFEGALPEENINGVHVIREGGRSLFNFRVPVKYFTRFRDERYDVVVDDMNKIPFFTPIYVREPLCFILHHLFGSSIFQEASWPVALYVYLAEKAGVAVCRKKNVPVMVVSPSTKNELEKQGFSADMIEIVYNCVDHSTHWRDEARRSPVPLIGYFGRLKKYKFVEHLLRALPAIRMEVPDVKLVIIGEGDNRASLEDLARRLGVSEAVRFMGFVDDKEKVRLLQEAWFVVSTSSKEGWGLTVIEANACGTTVLASNVPGLRDAVRDGETGLLYEFGNIDELSAKIKLLLRDASLRQRLADAAYAWAQTFDWEMSARRTLAFLERRVRSAGR